MAALFTSSETSRLYHWEWGELDLILSAWLDCFCFGTMFDRVSHWSHG